MSEIISWNGFVYHFLRSLSVKAQRPCTGLVLTFGLGLTTAGTGCRGVDSRAATSFADCSFSTKPVASL
jgi:hypothetical protein